VKSITGSEESVWQLLHPESVAVIGASSRPGALSWWPLHLLQRYHFAGGIYPVNPNRDEIDGIKCVPDLAAIGHRVDVAVVALNAENSVEAVRECASAGVGAVILPSQGFGELGAGGRSAEQTMLDAARHAGMRIVGPNTDGVANLVNGAVLSIQPLFGEDIPLGDVAVVTQSGASAGSLISRLKREGIGCRYYASAGNEIDLGITDYLSMAVQDESVRMVLSFVEAIRKPEEFAAVGRLAAELGKPIVLIKVGRTEQAAARAAAHTGALAGADRIYDALFDSLGIIRVNELSEIVAVAKYFLTLGRPSSRGLGVMSVSGGQAGALADLAIGSGLSISEIQPSTATLLDDLLPFGSALNPCDLTGEIATRETLAADVFRAMSSDPSIDTVVYARKELTGQAGRRAAEELAKASLDSDAALVVYAMDGGVNDDERATYLAANVPIFMSATELFTAMSALLKTPSRAKASPRTTKLAPMPDAGASSVLDQSSTNQLLRSYGIQVIADGVATSADDAARLAEQFGFPVVMKVVSSRIAHKTEIGGVLLNVADASAARAGFETLMENGRRALDGDDIDGVLIQQQVVDGVEMIAGLVIDQQFGPFVLVGSGGVFAELLDDVVLRPAPIEPDEAHEMIDQLRGKKLLTGFRGAEIADIDALALTVSSLSQLGWDHADTLSELDLNPVLVRPRGLGAVVPDALVVLAAGATS
jgi:acetate---CoA ligase (ADP-forming)